MNSLFRLMTFALLAGAAALSCSGAHAGSSRAYYPTVTSGASGPAVTGWATRVSPTGSTSMILTGPGVVVSTGARVPVATGVIVEAVVTGVITGASAAGGWGAAIGGIGAVAMVAIPVIKDWMDRAGVTVAPDGSLGKPDPSSCTSAPCYSFSGYGRSNQSLAQFCSAGNSGTPSSHAYAMAVNTPSGKSSCTRTLTWYNCTSADCVNSTDTYDVADFIDGTVSPSSSASTPATLSEAQAVMSATAPTAAAVQALVDVNFPPVVSPQSITGPSSVAGLNTVKLGLDGSNQTETCKYYLEYFPSNIKAHPECTTVTTIPERVDTKTVTTTNPDGTSSTQVISTKTPASTSSSVVTSDALKPADQLPTDTALADLPSLYTAKYPNGLVGVWAVQRVALVATPLANLTSSLMPSVASSGSCPSMMVNLTFSSWANFGTHNVAPPCSIWDFGRIVILISALLLARRLIFGG